MRLRWRRDGQRLDGRSQAAALGNLPMFSDCSGAELRVLDTLLCEARVPAGRVLAREGEPAEQMLIVVRGRARICRHGEIIGLAGPGTLVAGRELREHSNNSVTMIAETPMTVRVATARELLSLLDAVPRLDVFVWGEPVEPSSLADEVEAYLRAGADGPGQVLAALMFTDIVRSTGSLSVDSDYEWRQLVHAFHRIVARQVARYSGVVVTAFGDGALGAVLVFLQRCSVRIRDPRGTRWPRPRGPGRTARRRSRDPRLGRLRHHRAHRQSHLQHGGVVRLAIDLGRLGHPPKSRIARGGPHLVRGLQIRR